MTEAQLYALKNYIHQVTDFKIAQRLDGAEISPEAIERYEKKFDEIMLSTADGGENV